MSILDQYISKAQPKAASMPVQENQPVVPKLPPEIIKEEYRAFAAPTQDRQSRLIIYAQKGGYMMPKYDVMYDVFFSSDGSGLSLVFPHHIVIMYGQGLIELAAALRNDTVEWIRDFDPRIHFPVTDNRCFISEIRTEVRRPQMQDVSRETPAPPPPKH